MSIVRLSDQETVEPYPGVRRRIAAGARSGAAQLRVYDTVVYSGAAIPYHAHPNTESTHFVLKGVARVRLDGARASMSAGDLALAPPGIGHGFENAGDAPLRLITMIPHTAPLTVQLEPDEGDGGGPTTWIAARGQVAAWTPWDRCARFDMMNHERGALSTAFSELVFQPGSVAPPHYHPETEEAMYCVRGSLMAMYGGEEIPLSAGDMFVAEPGVRHTVFNASNEDAVLLPLHPTVVPVRDLVDWSPSTPLPG